MSFSGLYSSSPELSPPPKSSESPPASPSTSRLAARHRNNNNNSSNNNVSTRHGNSNHNNTGHNLNHNTRADDGQSAYASYFLAAQATVAPPPQPPPSARRSRKKRDPDDKDVKEAKERVRKPRSAKSDVTTAPPRKRARTSNVAAAALQNTAAPADKKDIAPPRQNKINQLVNPSDADQHSMPSIQTPVQSRVQLNHPPVSYGGNYDPIQAPVIPSSSTSPLMQSHPMPPMPVVSRTSGQRYDPIRSKLMDSPPPPPPPMTMTMRNYGAAQSPSPSQSAAVLQRSTNRASASPSISSLIDPPAPPPTVHVTHHSPLINKTFPILPGDAHSQFVPQDVVASQPFATQSHSPQLESSKDDPMDIDDDLTSKTIESKKSQVVSPAPPTAPAPAPAAAATPTSTALTTTPPATTATAPASTDAAPLKTNRQKELPPPMPQGSGLLSTTIFGPSFDIANEPKTTAPNIIIHVPIGKGEFNKTVNFLELAKKKYGADALNPRLAAHRQRMARIAAASSALEKNSKDSGATSADDMSVDLSDADLSIIELTGTGDATSAAEDPPKRGRGRKGVSKLGNYDRDDPFIDDSEELWLEQAAASKDGFFVYSGPLIPEGEKPTIERADGTVPRPRGRGAGRGRGGARSRTSAARAGHAAHDNSHDTVGATVASNTTMGTAATTITGATPTTRPTRARNSTGVRKSRLTKSEKANMEKEKLERERMATLAAKPAGYTAGVA